VSLHAETSIQGFWHCALCLWVHGYTRCPKSAGVSKTVQYAVDNVNLPYISGLRGFDISVSCGADVNQATSHTCGRRYCITIQLTPYNINLDAHQFCMTQCSLHIGYTALGGARGFKELYHPRAVGW